MLQIMLIWDHTCEILTENIKFKISLKPDKHNVLSTKFYSVKISTFWFYLVVKPHIDDCKVIQFIKRIMLDCLSLMKNLPLLIII